MAGIFIGYPDSYVGWKIYILSTRKIVISWDVIFDETRFPGLSLLDPLPLPSTESFPHLSKPGPYDYDDISIPMLIQPPATPAFTDMADHNSIFDDSLLISLPSDIEDDSNSMGAAPRMQLQPLPHEPSQCTRFQARHTNAEYYNAVQHQENHKSPLVQELLPPPPPSPYPKDRPVQPLWNINVGDIDAYGEQEVNFALNVHSDKALLQAGCAFMDSGVDATACGMLCAAQKLGAHDTNPRSFREAMSSENAAAWYQAM